MLERYRVNQDYSHKVNRHYIGIFGNWKSLVVTSSYKIIQDRSIA